MHKQSHADPSDRAQVCASPWRQYSTVQRSINTAHHARWCVEEYGRALNKSSAASPGPVSHDATMLGRCPCSDAVQTTRSSLQEMASIRHACPAVSGALSSEGSAKRDDMTATTISRCWGSVVIGSSRGQSAPAPGFRVCRHSKARGPLADHSAGPGECSQCPPLYLAKPCPSSARCEA